MESHWKSSSPDAARSLTLEHRDITHVSSVGGGCKSLPEVS